jgi:hypothetical protein
MSLLALNEIFNNSYMARRISNGVFHVHVNDVETYLGGVESFITPAAKTCTGHLRDLGLAAFFAVHIDPAILGVPVRQGRARARQRADPSGRAL